MDTFIPLLDVRSQLTQGKAFTASTGMNSISLITEFDYLLFKNPAGNSKNILITHIVSGNDSSTCRTILNLYKNPTITSDGTALSSINTHFDSSESATAEIYKNPTISDKGIKLNIVIIPSNSIARGFNRFYYLVPGNSLLMTVTNSVLYTDTFSDIYWLEVP